MKWTVSENAAHETVIMDEEGEIVAVIPVHGPADEYDPTLAQRANAIAALPDLLAALEKIAYAAPTEEPEYEVWGGDTEDAENWGMSHGWWEAAQIVREALAKAKGEA